MSVRIYTGSSRRELEEGARASTCACGRLFWPKDDEQEHCLRCEALEDREEDESD